MNPNFENHPPTPKKSLSNGMIALIVIGVFIGLCVLCGIIGGLMPKPAKDDVATNTVKTDASNSVKNAPNTVGNVNSTEKTIPSPTNVNSNQKPASNTTTPSPQNPNLIVNMPDLANKTPQDFDKIFGKATEITPITKTPEEMPGEFRHYAIKGLEDDLQVRFYKGKAVSFNIILSKDKQTKTPDELAKLCGFDVGETSGEQVSPITRKWQGKFGNAVFKEILVMKSNQDDYRTVVAKVAD